MAGRKGEVGSRASERSINFAKRCFDSIKCNRSDDQQSHEVSSFSADRPAVPHFDKGQAAPQKQLRVDSPMKCICRQSARGAFLPRPELPSDR